MKVFTTYIVLILVMCAAGRVSAQTVALKTNVLYDATSTLNLAVEVGLAPKWSLEISGNYNPWVFSDNKKIKHYFVQPEAKYWFFHQYNGHFVGVNVGGGEYNVGGLKMPFMSPQTANYRYEGWAISAGLSYGYSLILDKHWNLEFELGLGVVHTMYNRYDCATCGREIEHGVRKTFFAPTKVGISVVYIIK